MKIIKKKIHGAESRKKMMDGVNQLADVVGSTFGAKGRNVILDKEYGAPLIINDGVTIAREIFFEDTIQNLAAQLIKDAAIKTNEIAGDGTTGATILARAILREGWMAVEKGANPVLFRKELDKAVEKVVAALSVAATPILTVEQVKAIAKISVQDEEIGDKIGQMMFDIGKDGAVSLKQSLKPGVFIEKEGGMRMEGQLYGGVVENGDKWQTILQGARLLILKDEIQEHEFESKWLPFVRPFVEAQYNPETKQNMVTKVNVPAFVVVAEKLPRRIVMFMNENKHLVKWVWFRPTTALLNMKEIYKDLSAMTGSKVVCEEDGTPLKSMKIEDMGLIEKAIVGRHDMVVTVSQERMVSDEYLNRCVEVKGQIENAENKVEEEQIEHRYANLTGGVASIELAAATDQATTELQLRIEDAVNATRSAMQEGVVSGGGVALLNAADCLNDADGFGGAALKVACADPIRQILHNAGTAEADKLIKSLKFGEGVNVLTDQVVDMKYHGIIDPLKVIKQALLNAASVAGLLLTSEFAVTNEEDHADSVRKFFNPPRD